MTTVKRTHRWQTVFTLILLLSTAGVYLTQPLLLLASIVGIVYTAYPLLTPTPTIDLTLSRTLTETTPTHNSPVTVTVSVTNTGSETLPDLRLLDGVPTQLPVTAGTARHTVTLRPGATTTFQYTIAAKYGKHHFEPATAIAYDLSASTRIQTEITPEADAPVQSTLECTADIHPLSLHQTASHTGRTPSATSGRGIEFYQTRDYQRGDPASHINWRRFAKTGDLTTIEYRNEQLTTVILCLDARQRNIRTNQPDDPHAIAHGVAAARTVLSELRAHNTRVGIAIFGDEFEWLAPGTGHHHYTQASHRLRTCRTHPHSQSEPQNGNADASDQIQTFITQGHGNANVVLFSPLLDEFGVTALQQIKASGRSASVISPDVTTDGTVGGTLTRIERENRIYRLRNVQIPITDWTPGDPIQWPQTSQRGSRNG